MQPLAQERSKLFDREAERYDRCRPRYPDVVIDELLGPKPSGLDVLDVGCGTGIAARPMAERGAKVLGVELAPRMAEIARRHGIDVEIGAFEDWDAAGRRFDRVTSAQAWHWLDMPAATAKAASLLRPNGSLGLIWSGGAPPTISPTRSRMSIRRWCRAARTVSSAAMPPTGRPTSGPTWTRSSPPSPQYPISCSDGGMVSVDAALPAG